MVRIDSSRLYFLATDFQSLSAFRIAFAAYLLGDYAINVAPFFNDFYGATGVLPLPALAGDPAFSSVTLARILEFLRVPIVLPYLYPLALVCLLLGYRTRLATAAVFVFNSYLFWRNHFIVSGAEDLARLLLFWSLFLPLSRYWSVDAALDPGSRKRPASRIPFVATRMQISSVYVFSGLFKLAGPAWLGGSAIALALSDNIYGGTPSGLFLVAHVPGLLHVLTWLTICFQLCHPLLIYSPWRNYVTRALGLAGAILMHLSFIFCLNVGGFPIVCMVMLLVLIPDAWWNRLLQKRRARLARVQIFYEPGCGFCRRVSLLLREFFLSPTSAVLPADADATAHRLLLQNNSWVVRGDDGVDYLKWRAMAYVLRQNVISLPLAWISDLPSMRPMMQRLYDLIGANRHRLGPTAAWILPIRTRAPLSSGLVVLCGALAAVALICNLSTAMAPAIKVTPLSIDTQSRPDLKHIASVFDFMQVGQRWDLFAPRPSAYRRRFEFDAILADGSQPDVTARLTTPWFHQSSDGRSIVFVNRLWLKYFNRLVDFTGNEWLAFGDYVCGSARMLDLPAPVTAVRVSQHTQAVSSAWPTMLPPIERHTHSCMARRPAAAAQ